MTTRGEQNDLNLEAGLFGFEFADQCAANTAPSSDRALVTASSAAGPAVRAAASDGKAHRLSAEDLDARDHLRSVKGTLRYYAVWKVLISSVLKTGVYC